MSPNDNEKSSNQFIKQNSKNQKTKKQTRNGGPYTINNKDKRRDEVYRLHFEYGYSARKISGLMEINRNTINADIDYWYSKICDKVNVIRTPEDRIRTTLEKMNIQLSRLREELDKSERTSEKISIERLIYDINSKIINTYQKFYSSLIKNYESSVRMYNESMEKNHLPYRKISVFDTGSVSDKAYKEITRIMDEDRLSQKK